MSAANYLQCEACGCKVIYVGEEDGPDGSSVFCAQHTPEAKAARKMRKLLSAILLHMNEAPGCPDCGIEDGEHDETCRAVEIERVLNAAAGEPDKHVPTAQDESAVENGMKEGAAK